MKGLPFLLLAVAGLSLWSGPYPLSGGDPMAQIVLLEYRLPRLLLAMGCGAGLALSGALLQGLTRNPLADPGLLGVSQGAALAVVALIVLTPAAPFALRLPVAFGGALAAAALVQTVGRGAPLRLILSGIGLSALLAALISALLTHGGLREAETALGWLAGSLHAATLAEAGLMALILLALAPLCALLAPALGVLRLGEEVALALGLPLLRVRRLILLAAVLAAAAPAALVGPLGFIGLIAPHLAARLSAAPGRHLWLSALTGAALLALADLAGRSLGAVQVPAGLITSILGAPLFLWLLIRRPAAGGAR
ncbi:MAG: iron ABC transporter permease [Gemmobacter sp.]|uniref:FecCD family ABC transporter permease n=1 Tax=Gemmobacter sp. TaxID=1898957 RepID=UPI001A397FFD|nr:iron chelate uptake ABC transporter family permease subunit [Gemmobacter sp.]MBL8560651.1 iron ABC transporter permease [Gemmobacter sp.]